MKLRLATSTKGGRFQLIADLIEQLEWSDLQALSRGLAAPRSPAREAAHARRECLDAPEDVRGPDPASAARELELVHRAELARLLRVAGEWKAGARLERAWCEVAASSERSRWRREALLECVLALADGVEGELLEQLVALLLSPRESWPQARELVESSLTARDGEQGRLLLARIHLANEEPRAALAVLSAALRRGVSEDQRWRLYTGLGRAHELCGGERLALDSFRLASGERDPGATPFVDGFFLALALGEPGVAEELAAGLERAGFSSRELLACRRALCTRLRRRAVPLPFLPSERVTRSLFLELCEQGDGPTSTLCRELSSAQAVKA